MIITISNNNIPIFVQAYSSRITELRNCYRPIGVTLNKSVSFENKRRETKLDSKLESDILDEYEPSELPARVET